ncbi:hypothetical protein GCK72_011192 [Caenorhabditis remanei]|uniref:Uncharacterized protein n=1 Tax=Caenorhabditis remanei TaxID=31234 RepID=A0A6A5H5C2_CAERE|nr:hypothetical protein GCK72_011192 [Caenorhabditis remanei]KAF1762928.1 hypothetical protein GCK72_011192 [Caenorhabditis remanei]
MQRYREPAWIFKFYITDVEDDGAIPSINQGEKRMERRRTAAPSIVRAVTKRSNGREHQEPRRSRGLQLPCVNN